MPDMTPKTEIERIAAGLTKAGQSAVIALTSDFRPAYEMNCTRQAIAGLVRWQPKLIEREWQDGCAQCTYYRLTYLGLALRAHLANRSDDDA